MHIYYLPKMYFLLRKCFCFPSRGVRNSQRCLVEATERPDLLVPVTFLHNAATITSAVTLIGFSSAKIPRMLNPGGSWLKTTHCSGFSVMKVLGCASNTLTPKPPLSLAS